MVRSRWGWVAHLHNFEVSIAGRCKSTLCKLWTLRNFLLLAVGNGNELKLIESSHFVIG